MSPPNSPNPQSPKSSQGKKNSFYIQARAHHLAKHQSLPHRTILQSYTYTQMPCAVAFDIDDTITVPSCEYQPDGHKCWSTKALILEMVALARSCGKVYIVTARPGRSTQRIPTEVLRSIRASGTTDNEHFHAGPRHARVLSTEMQKVRHLQTIAQRNGLKTQDVILIDDRRANCTEAIRWGFRAIWIKHGATRATVEELRQALACTRK